jgi:hypothetical protein
LIRFYAIRAKLKQERGKTDRDQGMITGINYVSNDTYSHHQNGLYNGCGIFSKLKFLKFLGMWRV